jgi:hypothetical protein
MDATIAPDLAAATVAAVIRAIDPTGPRDHVAVSVRVKCCQNRLFSCGRFTRVPGMHYTLGASLRRLSASGRCRHCNLPVSVIRTLSAPVVGQ